MKKILIVEDDPTSCELYKAIFKNDFIYNIVNDGKTAIEYFKKNKYGVILMDIRIPIIDGITATKKIRKIELEQNLKKTPIFAITASNKSDSSIIFDEYILKPLNCKDLIKKINKITIK